ncbi:3,9-dihydroxypterocarpan 6A-monooxygenase-like [Herrania umbratica]|uniref:3,9-dihydroxypterocarpan 6A-monooxygenase-like n=1 Tax=Herrania umbratica TaxID=108875 RepID=A0A6J1A6M0_9ROSI|nr:3,9-dihydroxypterocarpan 6A-monooxygenase-like [Herrania umbratica]
MATSTMLLHCSNPIFVSIISIIIIYLLIKLCTKPKSSVRYPPSPLVLPIIGHLHLLSSSLPKSFQTLARRYGPLMRVHIGQSIFVVVSDAAMAKEVLRIHDGEFASRFEFGPAEYGIYKDAGFITSPYGRYWRFMKKLCMTKLFSGPQLDRFNHIRKEEIMKLLKSLMKRSREGKWCDLSAELANLTNNLIFRMAMGKRFSKGGNEANEMWKLVVEIMGLAAKLGVNEVHGLLKKIDLFGNGKKLREALERYDRLVEEIIKDYEENRVDIGGGNEDLMHILLETYREKNAELKITRDQIKNFILELFIASIDTSSAAIQWAMAELINHPKVFKKVREEIDSVVKSNRLVNESDVPNLPYLQAIAKETLRLHSPVPIFHRECTKDCKINGFDLQVKDRVLINAYAIMRHPEAWSDPDKFLPERFLYNSSGENNGEYLMEIKDQGFWFLPFGGGRRGCAGSLHAYLITHGTVGALVQCFDWKTKDGEKVDISVGSGFSGAMALPMECYPVLRFDPFQK